jgi:type IV pilus assembly protein PilY1
MPTTRSPIGVSRFLRPQRVVALGAIAVSALGVLSLSSDANAQVAGTNSKPLPNVLLLVDSSGSMERMPDNSLPSANRNPTPQPSNVCAPGTATNPNRWGMLLQALTGNMQPYYSCDAVDRASPAFKNEFRIAGKTVYDADYFLPYHRPLTGVSIPSDTSCTFAAYKLPGVATGSGVGPGNLGSGGDASDFPPTAFTSVFNKDLKLAYGGGSPLAATDTCTFEQAVDGQLDAAKDYVRFALMTFDNDTNPGIGVSIATPPSGNVDTTNPFLGQWSYIKSSANLKTVSASSSALGFGLPASCGTTPVPAFEVGARHAAAPPWEGRMVGFAPSGGNLFDMETTNDQIQKVLLGTRPYGATPIEGMLEDARDYLLFNPLGPASDPYVSSGCREQFIILLTDGAPNLDLRPSCANTGTPNGQCPYNPSSQVVDELRRGTDGKPIKTYVIGFSVNGAGDLSIPFDGFPAPGTINNCKAWYASFPSPRVQSMQTACSAPSTKPPTGSTAEACCKLNEIAYWGSGSAIGVHDTGPFFAETQADLVLSFGRILGGVSKTATTRTLPGYSPAVSIGGVNTTGTFVASFIPNAQKVWSGEIDRTRSICGGVGGIVPTPQPQDFSQGDSFADSLSAQAITGKRIFISVVAQVTGGTTTVVDSARTIRPYASGTPSDGLNSFVGAEVSDTDDLLKGTTNWAAALDIAANVNGLSPSCKRSKGVAPGTLATVDIPALSQTECKDVIWDFAVAHPGPISAGSPAYSGFNVRCGAGLGNLSTGSCSISGALCSLSDPAACTTGTAILGEVCVPACSALGGIYRSSPALVGIPNQFLRDDSYQLFAQAHATRRQVMYVASMDGVLHAFKALSTNTFDPNNVELWAFVPPAVLPKIASNYPSGQQILLDGTPVIKDTVWDRPNNPPAPKADDFHTTLVAGMGAGGAGYYAMNVTDTDCDNQNVGGFGGNPNGCQGRFTAATNATTAWDSKGPHFLWQFTDVEQAAAGDPAKKSRVARDGTQLVSLFGKESGTPAIATLQVDPGNGVARQIGVAILPGGIDGPPVKGGSCPRAVGTTFPTATTDSSATGFSPRTSVRQWATTCTDPVPGRGVTIVRLDTGEIIRHFGRATQDVPKKILAKTINSPFDSPIIGTPAIYPNTVGTTTQKIFVGDADGTVWRIDVSSPDPTKWSVSLFQDLVNVGLPSPTPTFAQSQPIALPMLLSQDPSGSLVLNVATGDQENLSVSAENNYVYSLLEQRPAAPGGAGQAKINWYSPLLNAERVTGPMTVFDRTLYFASYKPAYPAAGTCDQGGVARLWGVDYVTAEGGVVAGGGSKRWCPIAAGVDVVTQACAGAVVQSEPVTDPALKGAIIPGVTVQAAQSCASFGGSAGDPVVSGLTSTSYQIFFGATTSRGSGTATGTPQAERRTIARPLPKTTASIDAWALVVD